MWDDGRDWSDFLRDDARFQSGYAELMRDAIASDCESIIDLGCGPGVHTARFAEAGKRVVGIDEKLRVRCVEEAKRAGYELIEGTWSDLADASFDAGWSHHCLEHARDPIGWLHEWARIVRPGGSLFLAVPLYRPMTLNGHIAKGWDVGQMFYLPALAGWDATHAKVWTAARTVCGIYKRPTRLILHSHCPPRARPGGSVWGSVAVNLPKSWPQDKNAILLATTP